MIAFGTSLLGVDGGGLGLVPRDTSPWMVDSTRDSSPPVSTDYNATPLDIIAATSGGPTLTSSSGGPSIESVNRPTLDPVVTTADRGGSSSSWFWYAVIGVVALAAIVWLRSRRK